MAIDAIRQMLLALITVCALASQAQSEEIGRSSPRTLESTEQVGVVSEQLISHIHSRVVTLRIEGNNHLGVILAQDELIVIPTALTHGDSTNIEIVVGRSENETRVAQILGIDRETNLTILRFVDSPRVDANSESVYGRQPQIGDKLIRPVLMESGQIVMHLALTTRTAPFFNATWHCPIWDASLLLETEVERFPQYGGPLFDIGGRLVALNVASRKFGPPHKMFSLSINFVAKIAKQINRFGRVQRGWLGVDIFEITGEVRNAFGLKNDVGVIVSAVAKGGPADGAGISRGDVILQFDDQSVVSPKELVDHINCSSPGHEAKLVVSRRGVKRIIVIRLKERPNQDIKPYDFT